MPYYKIVGKSKTLEKELNNVNKYAKKSLNMQNNSTVLYYKYIPLITAVRRKFKISIENKKQKISAMINNILFLYN